MLDINVGKVKEYREKDADLSTSIDKAIEYCIKENLREQIRLAKEEAKRIRKF
ncbi:MAG: hypothetical protein HFJ09_04445 [Lachnospiraceae bacterium]|nr:hypothetical protein [Lachnospiraceae bacterium]